MDDKLPNRVIAPKFVKDVGEPSLQELLATYRRRFNMCEKGYDCDPENTFCRMNGKAMPCAWAWGKKKAGTPEKLG